MKQYYSNHGSYRELLFDERWREKRMHILERDGYKCAICGSEKNWLYIISNTILIKMGGNFGRGNIMISILLHYVVLATKEDMQNLIFQLKQ